MKHWILNIPSRLRKVSGELDVKAVLCDKSWAIYNDEGVKQVFIFLEDGTLLVSTNGEVSHSSWKYVGANESLVVTSGDRSFMYHPTFANNDLFVLELDGVKSNFLILVNEKSPEYNVIVSGVQQYLDNMLSRLVEAELQEAARLMAAERERHLKAEAEEKIQKEYTETLGGIAHLLEPIDLENKLIIGFFIVVGVSGLVTAACCFIPAIRNSCMWAAGALIAISLLYLAICPLIYGRIVNGILRKRIGQYPQECLRFQIAHPQVDVQDMLCYIWRTTKFTPSVADKMKILEWIRNAEQSDGE